MIRHVLSVLAIVLPFVVHGGEQRDGSRDSKMSASVAQMVHWLPADTESLIVAQGSFAAALKADRASKAQHGLQSLSYLLFMQRDFGLLKEKLKDRPILVAIEGSRRFRSPGGLGLMPFEGCEILRFEDSEHQAVATAFEECAERADSRLQLAGKPIAVFKKRWEDDDWTFFVAQPQKAVLVCATDRGFLETVLRRMNGDGEGRALPDDLPEWKHMDVNAPFWAIRHYRQADAANDPTSPLRDQAAANTPDSKAIGFAFSYNPDSKSVKGRYLSASANAQELVANRWEPAPDGLTQRITLVAPGVVEILTVLENDGDVGTFLITLMAALGHAIYL